MEQNASSPQAVTASIRDNEISRPSPPPTRLALRVGVTGHRPNKLQSADEHQIRSQIHTALLFLKETTIELHHGAGARYLPDSPLLRVISPLAEGSDRFVAESGLALGFELQCPLPFPREEYEKDFKSEQSRARFHELLSQATAVLELDGSRNTVELPDLENESYEAAGRIVVNQSDVMIAIWDGQVGKLGSTGCIEAEAEGLGLPIIWVDSHLPHSMKVKSEQGADWLSWTGTGTESLANRIRRTLEGRQNDGRNADICNDKR